MAIGVALRARAIGRRNILVIPHLSVEPRTRDRILATGHEHVRFYGRARSWTLLELGGLTNNQQTTQGALVRQAMTQMTMRLAVVERDETAAALSIALGEAEAPTIRPIELTLVAL